MSATCRICHHVQPTGKPCGSPALRHEQFCYYHHPTRRPRPTAGRRPRPARFHLPPLDTRASIQCALAKVVARVAAGRLDPRTAASLLFALQIANNCLPGDSAPLAALLAEGQFVVGLAQFEPLADLLQTLRPHSHRRIKCPRSSTN